ncbi:MAG: translation initiation factor IF-1 [Candidatus Eremiobacteraeota bacterium]|nr:translation initiation factor IF-1 [Candidatus Eremiobacteraeota bacterium]
MADDGELDLGVVGALPIQRYRNSRALKLLSRFVASVPGDALTGRRLRRDRGGAASGSRDERTDRGRERGETNDTFSSTLHGCCNRVAASDNDFLLRGRSSSTITFTPNRRGVAIRPRNRNRNAKPRVAKANTPKDTKEAPLEVFGSIRQVFPSTTFSVELDNGHTILAHIAGRLRRHHIKLLPGDRVDVEVSPYDLTKGRIVYRYRAGEARRS